MKDNISNGRTQLMHPKLRAELAAIGDEIDTALGGNAVCRWAYTLRSFAEQDALFAQGRSKLFESGKRLGIVTNAQGGHSYHNYGLAVDIVLLTGGGASWDTNRDFDGDGVADWMECVRIFKAHGWEWGGDFNSIPDKPHFQKTFGKSIAELLQLHAVQKTVYVNF